MKNVILSIAAFVAVFMLSSCQKAMTPSSITFRAVIDDSETKTILSNGTKVLWENGDEIMINDVNFIGTADETHKRVAVFEKNDVKADPTSPFHAYYPASMKSEGVNPVLPYLQNLSTGDMSVCPMYAYKADAGTNDLQFKNVCAVLAVSVKSAKLDYVNCITVSSTNHAMSGEFEVDGSNNAVLTTAADALKKPVFFESATDIATTAEGKIFYLPIPIVSDSYEGLKIVVSGPSGSLTLNATKAVTVERNKMYSISTDGAVKDLTKGSGVVKAGAGRKTCAWTQLWADGPKFADFNLGATIHDYAEANVEDTDLTKVYKSPDYCGTYNSAIFIDETDISSCVWGDNWKTPSNDGLSALLGKSKVNRGSGCFVEGCTMNGRILSGLSSYSNNKLFFPFCSWRQGGAVYISKLGKSVIVWSSTFSDGLYYRVAFGEGEGEMWLMPAEYPGIIRPVFTHSGPTKCVSSTNSLSSLNKQDLTETIEWE